MTDIPRSFLMDHYIAAADNWMPMVAGAHPEITNIDKLWQTTRDTPFYVPREAFRIASREYTDHESAMELVNRLPENSLVPRSWFKPAFQHMSEDYLYVVDYTGKDTETGKEKTVSIAVFSSESLTVGEVLEASDESMASGRYGMEIEGMSSTMGTAYHKARAAW